MAELLGGAAGQAYTHVIMAFGATATAFSTVNIQPDSTDSKTWAKAALISGSLGAIRFTYDGTTPTTSLGHALTNGDVFRLEGAVNVQRFQAIALAGGTAQVQATFERDVR